MFLRRLLLVFSIVLCGSLALAAAASAAGFLGPGKYTFHSSSADAFFGMGKKGGPPSPSFMVSVSQGLNSFHPTAGGQPLVLDTTMVFVTAFDANGNGGFGCFIVPDNNFSISRDLQSAALHSTLTADEACPGFGKPVGGGKDGGVPGGNSGLVLPITVDVTWTATGPVTTFKQTFSVQCLDFNEDGNSTNNSTNAAATGSISVLTGQFTSEFANVSATDGMLDLRGSPTPPCGG